ncbi:myrosinase 1-like [Thrips palmi]|uniref:Myrosinase 1-like n=1 Tax=Thrips palmi TaxID=161013 RepID=A0A6P8XZ53_THRPL|nr:myrosinase 1-like [Thrips palmi]
MNTSTAMWRAPLLLVVGLGVLAVLAAASPTPPPAVDDSGEYSALPEGFIFGAGSSAMQTEGAATEGGKGMSVMDYIVANSGELPPGAPSLVPPDRAADSYHRYKEDVEMAAQLKLQAYRFSVDWSRLFPDGNISNPNPEGVQYYNNVIDELVKNNIQPMVTMNHFDYPLAVMRRTGGWTDPRIVPAFEEYAGFLFRTFGDRVKLWTTVNEPNYYCMNFAVIELPGLYTRQPGDDYKCSHHTVLAHAAAYRLYEREFKATQQGRVGAAALTLWATPNSTKYEDIQAAERTNLYTLGAIYGPLVHGDYPELMKRNILKKSLEEGLTESRLPTFTPEQKELIRGAADFLSFNAYMANVMADNSHAPKTSQYGDMASDRDAIETSARPATPGNMQGMFEHCTPEVLREATMWIRDNYDMPIFITENGWGDEGIHGNLPMHDEPYRSAYHSEYLRTLIKTIKEDNVNVIGYLAWSLLDSYEWTANYGRRFGLVHVDYENGTLARTLKDSAWFFQHIGETRRIPVLTFPSDDPSDGTTTTTTTTTAAPSSGDFALPSLRAVLAALAALLWLQR